MEMKEGTRIRDFDRCFSRCMSEPRFIQELENIGYPYWMSYAQRKIATVLLDPATHSLPWKEICSLAGYQGNKPKSYFRNPDHSRFIRYLEEETKFPYWMKLDLRVLFVSIRDGDGKEKWLEGGNRSLLTSHRQKAAGEGFEVACASVGVFLWMNAAERRLYRFLLKHPHPVDGVNALSNDSEVDGAAIYRALTNQRFVTILDEQFDFQSWMSWSQRKIYRAVLHLEQGVSASTALKKAGISIGSWYAAVKDPRFAGLVRGLQIPLSLGHDFEQNPLLEVRKAYPAHADVKYIEDPGERTQYLLGDQWDLRRLYRDYPRGSDPSNFILDFSIIRQINIRAEVKLIFGAILNTHAPQTLVVNLRGLARFLATVRLECPHIQSLSDIRREHVQLVVSALGWHPRTGRIVGYAVVAIERQDIFGTTPSNLVVRKSDVPPHHSPIAPRPMDNVSMEVIDAYLSDQATPQLAQGECPEPLSEEEWNAFIILRFTGLRPISICHLIRTGGERAHQGDDEGDPYVFVPARFAKTNADLRIPISHLNNFNEFGNPVVNALQRQALRGENVPTCADGTSYLFTRSVLLADARRATEPQKNEWLNSICKRLSTFLQLGSGCGPTRLIPIILRHTCITELAEAGVSIEQIAAYVGHASLKSTEHYYGLGIPYRMPGPPREPGAHVQSALASIAASTSGAPPSHLIAQIEMNDSVCESVITGADCCAMRCLACPYKDLFPKDISRVKGIVVNFADLAERADALGLVAKRDEYTLILKFNQLALSFLEQGKSFRGERDLPGANIH